MAKPLTHQDSPRIMVVEDNHQNRDLLVRVLHRWGYTEVDCLGDPREFLEKYRQRRPALVFLDFRMPYFSGQELLEMLRSEPGALDRTRVVMLTGDSGATLAQEVYEQGASAIVTKPYVLKDLREIIEGLLADLRVQSQRNGRGQRDSA